MADTIDKYRKIVERLWVKTNNGTQKWEYVDDETTFARTYIGDITLIIEDGFDDDVPVVAIELYRNGKMIDRFTDETVKGEVPSISNYESYFRLMSVLFDEARRRALGVDEAIDSVLDELEDNSE